MATESCIVNAAYFLLSGGPAITFLINSTTERTAMLFLQDGDLT